MDQEIPDISASQAEIPDISDSQACKPTTSKAHIINDVRNAAATLVLFLHTNEEHNLHHLNEADDITYSENLHELKKNANHLQSVLQGPTYNINGNVPLLESIHNDICELKEQALYLDRAKDLKAKITALRQALEDFSRIHQCGAYIEKSEEKLLHSLQGHAASLDYQITLECNNEKSILVGQDMVPKCDHLDMVEDSYQEVYRSFHRMKFDVNKRAQIVQLRQGIIEAKIHVQFLRRELEAVHRQSYQEPPHLMRSQVGMSTENAGSEKADYSRGEANQGTKRKANDDVHE